MAFQRALTLPLSAFLVTSCGTAGKPSATPASPAGVTGQFMRELFKSDRNLLADESFKRTYFSRDLQQGIHRALRAEASVLASKTEPGPTVASGRFNTTTFDA